MVSPALRELMQRGELVGVCDGPEVRTGSAEHGVCGDQVQLSVRCRDGRLLEVRWLAQGCPATLAIAALAARTWTDLPHSEATDALSAAIAGHGGLAAHERHAAALVLRALAAAMEA